jgi:hypothetical protein
LADLQYQLALDEEAVALNRKRLDLAKRLYGPDDPRVVAVLVDLSIALMASQRSDERNEAVGAAVVGGGFVGGSEGGGFEVGGFDGG